MITDHCSLRRPICLPTLAAVVSECHCDCVHAKRLSLEAKEKSIGQQLLALRQEAQLIEMWRGAILFLAPKIKHGRVGLENKTTAHTHYNYSTIRLCSRLSLLLFYNLAPAGRR